MSAPVKPDAPKPDPPVAKPDAPPPVAAPATAPESVAAPAPASEPKSPVAAPAPPPPASKPASKPAKVSKATTDDAPKGIHAVIAKAKGHAANAGQWIHSHPVQASLIGAGVAIGSLVAGWAIFKALRGGKGKKNQSRLHGRSINSVDSITSEFPSSKFEKRSLVDEIDWDDEEFLEFLTLFPDLDDIAVGIDA